MEIQILEIEIVVLGNLFYYKAERGLGAQICFIFGIEQPQCRRKGHLPEAILASGKHPVRLLSLISGVVNPEIKLKVI